MNEIAVLLVDDHALMREGLKQLLELEEDMHVVGEAVDGFDAVYKIGQLHPDVVLLDIRMPISLARMRVWSSSGRRMAAPASRRPSSSTIRVAGSA